MIKDFSLDLIPAEQFVGSAKNFVKRYYGQNMSPELKHGDLLLCRRISSSSIALWGHIHMFATEQGILIGRVNPGKDDRTVTMTPENPDYDSYDLPLSSIYEAALVVGRITEYAY